MSTENKMTRKEIKNPDPFVRVSSEFWEKVVENRKVIVGSIVGLVIAFFAFALIIFFL